MQPGGLDFVPSTPAIVYGWDAPRFPSGEVWPCRRLSGRGLSHYGAVTTKIRGSIIIITCGRFHYPLQAEPKDRSRPEILIDGYVPKCALNRFAERAIRRLIGSSDEVTMLRYISRDEARADLDTLRTHGFQIIETGDVIPGKDSAYAVCLGTGRMLDNPGWLDQVWPYEPFALQAAREPVTRFRSGLVAAARGGTDPQTSDIDLSGEVERHPECASELLGGGFVQVGHTDPDGGSFRIIRESADVDGLGRTFSAIARDLGLSLFDAGRLRDHDSEIGYFSEFGFWERTIPVPRRWKRLV